VTVETCLGFMEKSNGERYPCRWAVNHQSRSSSANITSETLAIFCLADARQESTMSPQPRDSGSGGRFDRNAGFAMGLLDESYRVRSEMRVNRFGRTVVVVLFCDWVLSGIEVPLSLH